MDVNGFDVSQFQSQIDWQAIQARDFLAVRVSDGHYLDPRFQEYWQIANGLNIRWLFAYHLTSDDDPQSQVDRFVQAVTDTGVVWRPGMGVALDNETSGGRPIASRQTVEVIGNALCTRFDRPAPLGYGYWSSYVRQMCAEDHWPLWLALPANEWDAAAAQSGPVVHQWGTAGPGEQPGFPVNNVDVNRTIGTDFLDAVTGRLVLPTVEGFTLSDLDTIQRILNVAVDNLGALDARLAQADADRDAAMAATLARMEALEQQMAAHAAQITSPVDPHTIVQGIAQILLAGVKSVGA